MFRGEIYGYVNYLQTYFMLPEKTNFFWIDVVCKYWMWLEKHEFESALHITVALFVMHGKWEITCVVLRGYTSLFLLYLVLHRILGLFCSAVWHLVLFPFVALVPSFLTRKPAILMISWVIKGNVYYVLKSCEI